MLLNIDINKRNMKPGPNEKKKTKERSSSEEDKETTRPARETKKITNVPEDRPGSTDTSQEKFDEPKPM